MALIVMKMWLGGTRGSYSCSGCSVVSKAWNMWMNKNYLSFIISKVSQGQLELNTLFPVGKRNKEGIMFRLK